MASNSTLIDILKPVRYNRVRPNHITAPSRTEPISTPCSLEVSQREISQLKELLQQEKKAKVEEDRSREVKFLEDSVARGQEEISKLKELLQQEKNAREEEEQQHGSKTEMEINKLKELLEKERRRGDSKKRIAMAEKKKAAKAWMGLRKGKARADEQRKKAEEEYKVELESMKKQAVEADSELARKMDEFRMVLKANVIEEQKRAEQRQVAEENMKMAMEEEKSRADELSHQLEEYRNKIEELQSASLHFTISRMVKCNEARSKLEAENHKLVNQRKSADLKAEEQRQVAEENRKLAMEEKSRADQLSHQLEEYRIMIEETTKVWKILEKELKLEKARVEHDKEVAALEKKHTDILLQELSRFKLDFSQMSSRLNALTTRTSARGEDKEKVLAQEF